MNDLKEKPSSRERGSAADVKLLYKMRQPRKEGGRESLRRWEDGEEEEEGRRQSDDVEAEGGGGRMLESSAGWMDGWK